MEQAKTVSAVFVRERARLSPRDRARFDEEISTFIRLYPELSKGYRNALLNEISEDLQTQCQ